MLTAAAPTTAAASSTTTTTKIVSSLTLCAFVSGLLLKLVADFQSSLHWLELNWINLVVQFFLILLYFFHSLFLSLALYIWFFFHLHDRRTVHTQHIIYVRFNSACLVVNEMMIKNSTLNAYEYHMTTETFNWTKE